MDILCRVAVDRERKADGVQKPGIEACEPMRHRAVKADPGHDEPLLLLVAACVLSGWTMEDIISLYKVSSAECIKRLVKLERIGLITLLPGNRVRPNVARGFDWRPGGPIQRFFRAQERSDYLASDFTGDGEAHFFLYGMLTPTAQLRLQAQLRKLREEFFELHREGLALPLARRNNCCFLVAQRHWEPKAFASMRREPK